MGDEENMSVAKQPEPDEPAPAPPHKISGHKMRIPRRKPSVIIPPKKIHYVTADKITCKECPCFPKEEPYKRPPIKLNPCLHTPITLYEMAEKTVDGLKFPIAFDWTPLEVADWMENDVGLPEYRECFLDNNIDGRRLLLLEDPSVMPEINIHCFDHIKMITAAIHKEYGTEFIKFRRSIDLPPRYPLTHCVQFKSRTGPMWGIRQNWDRCDILRWMKMLKPAPINRDHWELVWYQDLDFPKMKFARIPDSSHEHIPIYKRGKKEQCREYLALRKFRVQKDISEPNQYIWMEHRPGSPIPKETVLAKIRKMKAAQIYKPTIPKKSRLDPPVINLAGLTGRSLLLARRKVPKRKFLEFPGQPAP